MEQLPPQNIEAEEAYLGALISNYRFFSNNTLFSEDFYLFKHQTIFKRISELFKKHGEYDLISLTDYLETNKQLQEVGGRTYIANLVNQASFRPHIQQNLIKEKSILRKINNIGQKLIDNSLGQDTENIVFQAQELLNQVEIIKTLGDEVMPIAEIASKMSLKGKFGERYETQINLIDQAFKGGFKDGDLVIIAGLTGHGKTTLSQAITANYSLQAIPSLWFSYEVIMTALWEKFKTMGADQNFLSYAPLKNTSGSVGWIKNKIKEAKEKFYIKLVVIDHLGFLLPANKEAVHNYSAYLGQICRELKTIAIEEEIIIILPVHLRKTDNPGINDIRDSSAVAQEADAVLIVNRELSNHEEYGEVFTEFSQIKIEKNRDYGTTSKGWFTFNGKQYLQVFGKKAQNYKIKF